MGQKVSPHGLRVGINKDWDSRWFADKKEFAANIKQDAEIRNFVKKKLYLSGVSKIEIERQGNNVRLNIYTAKPGMVIGKGGQGIEDIKKDVEKIAKDKKVFINIMEVRRPETDAQLVAENIAMALERRIAFRRAMKQAMQRAMRFGAKGIKVSSSGRLGGAEMARREGYAEGNVPLHTLRADIGYGVAEADTTYGKIGVKVWICNGEILLGQKKEERPLSDKPKDEERRRRPKRRNDNRRSDRKPQGGRPRKSGEVSR